MTMDRDEFAECLTDLVQVAGVDNARTFSRRRDARQSHERQHLSGGHEWPRGDGYAHQRTDLRESQRAFVDDDARARHSARMQARVQELRTIAEQTDGIAIVDTNDLAGGIRRIVDDVSRVLPAWLLAGERESRRTVPADRSPHETSGHQRARPAWVRRRDGSGAPTAARAAQRRGGKGAAAGPSPVDNALAMLAKLRPTSATVHVRRVAFGHAHDRHGSAGKRGGRGPMARGRRCPRRCRRGQRSDGRIGDGRASSPTRAVRW
jgi:hypothetical protein